jgi:hypothetical protein
MNFPLTSILSPDGERRLFNADSAHPDGERRFFKTNSSPLGGEAG